MNEFDPIKAQSEILTGLTEVNKLVTIRAREAEQRHAEAEADFNALAKLARFTEELVETAHAKLTRLRDEAEAKAKAATDGAH